MQWAKERALELVKQGKHQDAFSSLSSDLQKHPDTANHVGLQLGMGQLMGGHLSTTDQMRDFITGFN
jgi:hypothetical protein